MKAPFTEEASTTTSDRHPLYRISAEPQLFIPTCLGPISTWTSHQRRKQTVQNVTTSHRDASPRGPSPVVSSISHTNRDSESSEICPPGQSPRPSFLVPYHAHHPLLTRPSLGCPPAPRPPPLSISSATFHLASGNGGFLSALQVSDCRFSPCCQEKHCIANLLTSPRLTPSGP